MDCGCDPDGPEYHCNDCELRHPHHTLNCKWINNDEQHTESVMDMTIDYVADAAYIVLNSNEVVETKELTSNINIDIDEFGNPCGVELLTLNLRNK